MFRLVQLLLVLSLFVLVGAGCESGVTLGQSYYAEGDDPGECSDGADNDGDGFFDCLDEACAGAPACEEAEIAPADPFDVGWDANPPEVSDRVRITVEISCGLFRMPLERTWEHIEGRWEEQRTTSEDDESPYWDKIAPCLQDSGKILWWQEDTTIQFLAGGWFHHLRPTTNENVWVGPAEPIEPPSDHCRVGLESLDLELPVTLSLTLLERQDPSP